MEGGRDEGEEEPREGKRDAGEGGASRGGGKEEKGSRLQEAHHMKGGREREGGS